MPFFQAFLQSQSKKVGLHFQSYFAKKDFQFRPHAKSQPKSKPSKKQESLKKNIKKKQKQLLIIISFDITKQEEQCQNS